MNKEFRDWLESEIQSLKDIKYASLVEFGIQKKLELVIEKYDELSKSVVIPRYVADWIEELKQGERPLYSVMSSLMNKTNHEWVVWESANMNFSEIVAQAWVDGYEVEKEKLYTVDLPPFYELIKRLDRNTYELKRYSDSGLGDYTNAFTEQEIKDYDKRFWAFAEEVTE